ncbi:juvenile hormone acid O-methyltransferase-like isoform X1 [Dermacentor albipictus]|uniref:juvenile hormone acid O-methyltransferase-like isoform X1 n=1 Tax=Dermacentor albipictus TaxID=60249 RepID=UPI0038FD1746
MTNAGEHEEEKFRHRTSNAVKSRCNNTTGDLCHVTVSGAPPGVLLHKSSQRSDNVASVHCCPNAATVHRSLLFLLPAVAALSQSKGGQYRSCYGRATGAPQATSPTAAGGCCLHSSKAVCTPGAAGGRDAGPAGEYQYLPKRPYENMSNFSKNPTYDAGLYASNNQTQRQTNLQVLTLLNMTFASSNTEYEQFLDLGCGTGDFTRSGLLASCPPCRRIVAVDASDEMLSYARENSAHSNIVFEHLNINDDVADFAAKYGTFSRIYSFFCLNWVKDQAKAMKNLASLLAPSGECLLVFPAWSPARMLWRKLVRLERWSKYAQFFESFVPNSQDLDSDQARLAYLRDILKTSGLTAQTCELLYGKPQKESVETILNGQISLNPAAKLMTPEEIEVLKADIISEVSTWTNPDAFSGRPALFLVHAIKEQNI